MDLVQYNRNLSDSNDYDAIAFNLMDELDDSYKKAKIAITRVNMLAVQFAKFVYQYYVCTDHEGKPIKLPSHVYDPVTKELDLLFFLSLDKVSYRHVGGLCVTKNLRSQIQHVYDLYSKKNIGKVPSVTSLVVYNSQLQLRKDFHNFLENNNKG